MGLMVAVGNDGQVNGKEGQGWEIRIEIKIPRH
jgi:hypothetical protein